ncbi:MAG: hypothetical protein ACR2IV_14385 [Bryobacteraceae bacterium]
MNWQSWLFWGTLATLTQLLFETATQAMRLTRMSLPYMLGTMFMSDRSKAKILGFAIHILNGLLFTLIYVAVFHYWGGPTWWRGALIGIAQAGFVLVVGMALIPELHPRMANERYGPTAMRLLEPPGFLP